MPVERGKDKQTVAHLFMEDYTVIKKQRWNPIMCNKIVPTGEHFVQQNKPVPKR